MRLPQKATLLLNNIFWTVWPWRVKFVAFVLGIRASADFYSVITRRKWLDSEERMWKAEGLNAQKLIQIKETQCK